MEECREFGVIVDGTGVNIASATVIGVDVEGNTAKDGECHEHVVFWFYVELLILCVSWY